MVHWKATYNTFATQTPSPYNPLAAGAGPPEACIIATHVLRVTHLEDAIIRPECTMALSILNVPVHVDGDDICGLGP